MRTCLPPREDVDRGHECYHRLVMTRTSLTALIQREGPGFVSLCPELDIASQGDTVEEATENLREAVELFLETADSEEIARRTHDVVYVARLDVGHG